VRPRGIVLGVAALAGVILAGFGWRTGEDAAVTRGRALYDANCAACHGADLEGQPDWRTPGADGRYPAPPHDASGHTWHHSDDDLIAYIALGGEEALKLMGVTLESGMPGFEDILSDREIVDILDYIKSRWPDRERDIQAERTRSSGG
jgi:mono/diheme cytochrome c family protein